MNLLKMKKDLSNPFMDKDLDKKIKKQIFDLQSREFVRAVPFITFDFYVAITDDGYLMPSPDPDSDNWGERMCCELRPMPTLLDEGMCVEILPMATALRVLIRPDVSKEKAIKILTKIIRLIRNDKLDWPQESNKFVAEFK